MNAILWDGQQQLKGYLVFDTSELIFRLKDFSEANLHLVIPYTDITAIAKHKLYGISIDAVEISTNNLNKIVFVVEDVEILMAKLEEH